MTKSFYYILVLIMISQNIFSQKDIEKKFGYRTHNFKGISIPYRIFIPENYSPKNKYPLVLVLHGSGERGNNNESQITANKLATCWADSNLQAKNPSIVFAPQCPLPHNWVLKYTNNENLPISPQLETVLNIMDTLIAQYSIDINRLYITGLSMGGFATWDIITRYPDRFAAAIPICGGGNPENITKSLKMPIWVFHGQKDPVVPPIRSKEMLKALEKTGRTIVYTHLSDSDTTGLTKEQVSDYIEKGAGLLYTEFKNVGHDSWVPAYNYPLLFEWVFRQRKK